MQPWKRIEPTITAKIDYHELVIKTFEQPNGKIVTRTIFQGEGRQAAGVVAVTKEGKVVVGRQFRPGPEKVLVEIPGGYVDKDEEPEEAARRELLEETGYKAGAMTFLGEFDRDAYMNGKWYYYLATDCELAGSQNLDHDEFVSIELLSIQDFIDTAKRGGMTDPFAVLAALDQLNELQKKEG